MKAPRHLLVDAAYHDWMLNESKRLQCKGIKTGTVDLTKKMMSSGVPNTIQFDNMFEKKLKRGWKRA